MSNGLRIFPDSLRIREGAGFNGSYQTLGTPLRFASPLLKIVNNSNVSVTVSWDGINDHDIIPANSFALYDFCSDAGTIRGLFAAKNTQFYVKASVGTGSVYLVVFYTSEDL